MIKGWLRSPRATLHPSIALNSYSLFKLLKEETIRLSDEGFTLLRMSELKQQLEMRLPDDPFTYEEL